MPQRSKLSRRSWSVNPTHKSDEAHVFARKIPSPQEKGRQPIVSCARSRRKLWPRCLSGRKSSSMEPPDARLLFDSHVNVVGMNRSSSSENLPPGGLSICEGGTAGAYMLGGGGTGLCILYYSRTPRQRVLTCIKNEYQYYTCV